MHGILYRHTYVYLLIGIHFLHALTTFFAEFKHDYKYILRNAFTAL